jgi:hypothetical protein
MEASVVREPQCRSLRICRPHAGWAFLELDALAFAQLVNAVGQLRDVNKEIDAAVEPGIGTSRGDETLDSFVMFV